MMHIIPPLVSFQIATQRHLRILQEFICSIENFKFKFNIPLECGAGDVGRGLFRKIKVRGETTQKMRGEGEVQRRAGRALSAVAAAVVASDDDGVGR